MQIALIITLIVVGGIFIWQAILFVRDLIKFIKNKKAKKSTDENNSAVEETARKE